MGLQKLQSPLLMSRLDFRIQSINKGGYATILVYKNARVDMDILDEVVGPENWQRSHKEVKGVVYCGIGILCNDHWVWKWDAGSESMSEKEKGESSDSFKRAGFNWGIGRELYNYPKITVKLFPDEFSEYNGKMKASFNLKLYEWRWKVEFDEYNNVTYLGAIHNNKVRFTYGELKK